MRLASNPPIIVDAGSVRQDLKSAAAGTRISPIIRPRTPCNRLPAESAPPDWIVRKCRRCGAAFATDCATAYLCSEVCGRESFLESRRRKEKLRPESRKCDHCGKRFKTTRHARFCCTDCQIAARKLRVKEL